MAFCPGDQKNTPIFSCSQIRPLLLGGGGVLSPGAINIGACDYWDPCVVGADIATKESLALNNVLQSFRNTVRNSWVDPFAESQVLLHSWNRRGSRSHFCHLFSFVLFYAYPSCCLVSVAFSHPTHPCFLLG